MSKIKPSLNVLFWMLFVSLISTGICYGHMVLMLDFDGIVNRSEIILVGKVKSVVSTGDGKKHASFMPVNIIKGGKIAKGRLIKYGNFIDGEQEDRTVLEVGRVYLMFMSTYKGYYEFVGGHNTCFAIDNNERIVSLDGRRVELKEYIQMVRKSMLKNARAKKK